MNHRALYPCYLLLFSTVFVCTVFGAQPSQAVPKHSPYIGQESRSIAALSHGDSEGLKAGSGTPFGGMALAAELNGFPGPKHVLELETELNLTAEQKLKTMKIFEEMKASALPLGRSILATEGELDQHFKKGTITGERLKKYVSESARLFGELRSVHLSAHLAMMEVLNRDQANQYSKLRGYGAKAKPCKEVPSGHDPEMWKLHHGCG